MPLDPLKPPEAGDIDKFLKYQEDTWEEALTKCRKADEFYNRTYAQWTGIKDPIARAQRPRYHSSFPTSKINQATDALSTYAPQVTRPPSGKSKDAKAAADRIEPALTEFLVDSFTQEHRHPGRDLGEQFVKYSYGSLFTGLNTKWAESRPEQIDGETQDDLEARQEEWEADHFGFSPIKLEVLPPGAVLMDWDNKHPDLAVVRRWIPAYQLADFTLRKLDSAKRNNRVEGTPFTIASGQDPYEPVEITQLWGPRFHAMKGHGDEHKENLFVEPNTWGYQPHTHGFAGGGAQPVGEKANPKWLIEGILHPVMEGIKMRDERFIATHTSLMRLAFAKRGTTLEPTQAARALAGDVLFGREDDWWAEKFPDFPNQMFAAGPELEDEMRQGTFDPQVAGFPNTNIDTATAALITAEASSRRWLVAMAQMGALFTLSASFILRLAARLNEEYGIESLNEHSATPLLVKDIGKNFRVFVRFENLDPVVLQSQKAEAREEMNAEPPLQSWEGYQRIARVANATKLKGEILDDKLERLPAMEQEILAAHAKQRGLRKLGTRLEEELDQIALVGPDGQPLVERQGVNGDGSR